MHTERHKNIVTRKTFCCLIDGCKRSFLYICTLKKHFQKEHNKIYSQILDYFPGNQRSFLAIYKYLLSNPESCQQIKLKSKHKDSKLEFKAKKEISFNIAQDHSKSQEASDKMYQGIKKLVFDGINYVNFSQRYMSNVFMATFGMIQNFQGQLQKDQRNDSENKSQEKFMINPYEVMYNNYLNSLGYDSRF